MAAPSQKEGHSILKPRGRGGLAHSVNDGCSEVTGEKRGERGELRSERRPGHSWHTADAELL